MKDEDFNAEFRARLHRLLKTAGKTLINLSDKTGYSVTTLKKIARGEMTTPVKQAVIGALTMWSNDEGREAQLLFDCWQPRDGNRAPAADPALAPAAEALDRSGLQIVNGFETLAPLLARPGTLPVSLGLRALSTASDLPDILTPGGIALLESFAPEFPEGMIGRWAALGEEAIAAVEQGDFQAHVTVGQRIVDESGGVPQICAAGHYLKAEGHRLLAGMNKDQQVRAALLDASLAGYALAAEIYPHSPRAIRGSASVLEAQGDLGQALDHYARAKGMSLEQAHTPSALSERPLLLHEILRATRHEIHCISEIRRTSPASAWRRVNKEEELRGFLVYSQNSHHEFLMRFRFRWRWYLLEWFMALVFFGKVWGDLGDSQGMTNSLLRALKVRRVLISGTEPLTPIERANLLWWMNTALSRDRARTWGSLVAHLNAFENALHTGSTFEILSAMDEMITFITAPSEQDTP